MARITELPSMRMRLLSWPTWDTLMLAAAIGAAVTSLVACRPRDTTAPTVVAMQGPNSKQPAAETEITPAVAVEPPRLVSDSMRQRDRQHREALDPTQDGWVSESFADRAEQRLHEFLTKVTSTSPLPSGDSVLALVTDDFRAMGIASNGAADPVKHATIMMRRLATNPSKALPIEQTLTAWRKWLDDVHVDEIVVKTVDIDLHPDRTITNHEIEIAGRRSLDAKFFPLEQHSRWTCTWDTSGDVLRLQSVDVHKWDEFTSRAADTWFTDDTLSAVGATEAYKHQLRHGLNHWLTRLTTSHGMHVFAEYGVAVGDANGDGFDDLYVCQPGGLPNRLLLHAADHKLIDFTHEAGVDWLDHTSSALFVDLDNDGDQDLAIALDDKRVVLMQNDGDAHFQVASNLTIEDRHVQSLNAVDYDRDGDLDLYLTVGFAAADARPHERRPEFVYYDANEGGANVLFRNDIAPSGSWSFADVTRKVGLDVNNRRHSLAAAWEDFDNDGDQDLYVANDYGQNCFYRNNDGRFEEIAPRSGTTDAASGMSVAWSDVDRDGQIDLYVGNMFSSAGNRITNDQKFAQAAGEGRHVLRRFVKGNTLFRNNGNTTFADVGEQAEVQLGRWAYSSVFADIDNDGWDDIFVANGYITNPNTTDL